MLPGFHRSILHRNNAIPRTVITIIHGGKSILRIIFYHVTRGQKKRRTCYNNRIFHMHLWRYTLPVDNYLCIIMQTACHINIVAETLGKLLFQQVVNRSRVGLAAGEFHHLPNKKSE